MKTVLEGSVRKSGNRLRINAQLINTADGYHVWSDRYDREMDDIFLVQDEMASAIVSELKVQLLAGDDARLIRPSTVDVEAYNLYLKGRHCLNKRTEETLKKAISLFEDAIARDPGYAAYAISRAIELDPLALVYNTAKGRILSFARRHDEAVVQFRHMLELDPNFAQVHFDLGASYAYKGRFDEAIAELEKGLALGGRRTLMVSVLGSIYGLAGRRSKAQAVLEELQELAQKREVPAFYFAFVHVGLGDMSDAITALERAYEERTGAMVYLKVEPGFDPLRSDPRFQVLQRMNFPTCLDPPCARSKVLYPG